MLISECFWILKSKFGDRAAFGGHLNTNNTINQIAQKCCTNFAVFSKYLLILGTLPPYGGDPPPTFRREISKYLPLCTPYPLSSYERKHLPPELVDEMLYFAQFENLVSLR